MSEWYLKRHRPRPSRPVESWHAWRYWRRFVRDTPARREAVAAFRAAAATTEGDESR